MSSDTIIDELFFRLLRVPIFADINRKHLYKIAVEASAEFFPTGEVVFREGDYSFDFYVILQGMVRIQISAAEGEEYSKSLGRNRFFGEMASLSYLPRDATITAEAPSYLLKISDELFQELLDNCPSFKDMIDQKYRERAIYTHLRMAPVFSKFFSKEKVSKVANSAQFVLYRKGEYVCRQGEEADGFYMIRRGYAQVLQKEGKQERTLAYLTENMHFGETNLVRDEPWQMTVRALAQTELIKIKKELFEKIFEQDAGFKTSILQAMEKQKADGESVKSGDVEIFAQEGLIQARNAILIDLSQCIRCNRCVESCRRLHKGASRLIRRKGFRYQNWLIASSCYNCQSPDCMLGCKFSAIRRDISGHIHIIEENCRGCGQCVGKCPYGVIQLVEVKPASLDKKTGKKKAAKYKAVICDQCVNLGIPACLHNCPVGAIYRGDPTELLE